MQYLTSASRVALAISLTTTISYSVAADEPVDPFSVAGEKTVQAHAVAADEPANLLSNGGAEQGGDEYGPPGWSMASVPAPSLRLFIDNGHSRAGKACLAISNQHKYVKEVANNWVQDITPIPVGKTLRLSAYVRTTGAQMANVCVQCWADDGDRLVGFASTPVFRGTQGWTLAEADELVVPPETTLLCVRAALVGTGTAYFDDVTLKAVEQPASPVAAATKTDPYTSFQKDFGAASAAPTVAKTDELAGEVLARLKGRLVRRLPLTKDNMVLAYMSGWNHGNVDNIAVANNNGGVRTLLDWEKPSPDEIAKPGRRFFLALYSHRTTLRGAPGPIGVYEVLTDWGEMTSWDTLPRIAERPVAQSEMTPGEGWKFFDVTPLVRKDDAPHENHGVVLRFEKETTKAVWSGYAFISREALAKSIDRRPVLLVIDAESHQFSEP